MTPDTALRDDIRQRITEIRHADILVGASPATTTPAPSTTWSPQPSRAWPSTFRV